MEREEFLTDPSWFFERIVGKTPYPYQTEFLRMTDKRIAIRSGRQVGKSLVVAVKALWKTFMFAQQTVLIIAPTLRQSQIIFRYVKFFLMNEIFKDSIMKDTTWEIWFNNGSIIHCLPSSKEAFKTIRGFSPNLIIVDEAAFVDETAYSAIEPSLAMTNGDLILISTPYGRTSFFYEAFRPGSEFKTMHIRSADCPNITREFLEKRKNDPRIGRNEYLQEYEGEFTSEADNFFKIEDIEACMTELETDMKDGHKYDIGVDVARFGEDETVIIVVDKVDKKVVRIDSLEKKPITETLKLIKYWFDRYKADNIIIDSASVGGGAVDILKVEGYPVVSVNMNAVKEKETVYDNLKILIEEHIIRLIKNPKLKFQLGDMVYEHTQQGRHISASSSVRHDDLCFCAGTKILTNKGQISIEKIKVNDYVMTRKGFKKVKRTGNRYANVIKKLGLIGTPDHPFITPNGIESFINVSDVIYIWNEKLSYIEEKHIRDIQTQKEGNLESTIGIMENGKHHQNPCIDKYGKMKKEKYQKDSSYTTKTETHKTIQSKILKSCQRKNINQNILQKKEDRCQEKTLKNMQDQKPYFGTNQKREENGIENTRIIPYQKLGIRKVYNITVEECNEFFANNILVHNSDSLALACMNIKYIQKADEPEEELHIAVG